MLNQIRAQGAVAAAASLADALRKGDTSDAIDLLLGCHCRIRHFTTMARRLAEPEAPSDQIPAAARAVYRYYKVALPLHEADENQSVYPRLRAAAPPGDLADANQAMVDQHVSIDRIIAELLPQWEALEQHPGTAPATAAAAQRLDEAWRDHLELEERLIFPALRAHLSQEDRTAIRQEMIARRNVSGAGAAGVKSGKPQ
ncbi:MAG: hemerythrin domain-containing protein [Terriglobales bacterium]